MPKLILKSPYLKCGGKDTVSGYLRYIGTRDGVELVPDGRPATKRQEQLIRALVRDFPDSKELLEYADWERPTPRPTPPRSSPRRWSAIGSRPTARTCT